jgi:hypothetical protein
MATVYSLICFGGRDGKTVTFTDAGDVVNLTNHGLRDGTGVVFTDNSNTLPTGLSKDTTYYAKSTGTNTFTLYTTSGLTTQVTFTGTGSGTHKVKSAYYVGLSDKSRWTYGGTEYIYESLKAWRDARNTAGVSVYTPEVCEIGMGWVDVTTAVVAIDWAAPSTTITTVVNGSRVADAFHNGVIGSTALSSAGYCIYGSGASCIDASAGNVTVDGLFFVVANSSGICFSSTRFGAVVKNNVFRGNKPAGASSQAAIRLNTPSCVCSIYNNIWLEIGGGGLFTMANQGAGSLVYNNLAHNCNVGFYAEGSSNRGFYYNNISVGNDTNWTAAPSSIEGAGYNGGESGNTPWNTGTATAITTFDSTDFTNYTTHDFRPASSAAPQVETGTAVPSGVNADIVAGYRPSYINVTTDKWDLGPFEYDWGNGLPPVVRSLDFTGLVSGSQVVIYSAGTTTELSRTNSTGTSLSYDTVGASVDYTILKAGYFPIRVTGVTLTSEANPTPIQQQLDRAYVAPSGLTFGTNVIVNVTSRVVTSLQVTTATTVQNWYSYLMDCWIDSATNTTLKNVAFPVIPFGEASFTTTNGIEFSDGATSIAFFSRDGLRYSSNAGVTATAIWSAILTLDTPAGTQIKYRQSPSGSIVSAANTGPMDQLVQVYGDVSHGNFDYRDHMVLRAPNPGYSQPMPDLVATYGNLSDGLYVAAMAPALQYATTNADIDATHLVLDNTAKTFVVSAAHTMLELYQRAQWWANQDAQWDADIPLITTDGSTFTQPDDWTLSGVSYLTGGTLSGGKATLAAGTQGIAYSGVEMTLGAAGIYTFTMAGSSTVIVTPTAPSTYSFGNGSFIGTLTVNNATAHAVTIDIPDGVTTSTTGNTGGAITFNVIAVQADALVSNIVAGSRLQIYNVTTSTETYNDVVAGTSYSASYDNGTGYSDGDVIRVRLAYQSGATAKLPTQYLTVATANGWSVLADQADDTVYIANAIDGSTVTEFTADYPNVQIDINDGDGLTTPQRGYAWYISGQMTADGIRYYHGGMTAEDDVNYRINVDITDMHIQNVSASPVLITGARLYRSDGTRVTVAGTGPIEMEYGRAYPVETGVSGLTPTESSKLFAIPSAVEVASEVWTGPDRTLTASADPSAATIASEVWQQPIESLTAEEMMRVMVAALAGKTTGIGTDTENYLAQDGITPRITATFDADNNRDTVTLNGTA